MKRQIRLALSIVFVAMLWSAPAEARFQRLAISLGRIMLDAASSSAVEAFCLDPHLDPPPAEGLSYPALVGGESSATVRLPSGERIAIAEALSRRLLEIAGRDGDESLEVVFKNLSNTPLQLEFSAPFAVAPTPAPAMTPLQAREIARETPDQFRIWSAAEHVGDLRALNYDLGSTDADTIAAVRRFQRDAGLPADGLVGRKTAEALRRRTEELRNQLEAAGFDTDAPLDDVIRDAERAAGLPETGTATKPVQNYLEREAGRIAAAGRIFSEKDNAGPAAPALLLRDSQQYRDVVTFHRGLLSSGSILLRKGSSLEVWKPGFSGRLERIMAEDPVAAFDRDTLYETAEASTLGEMYVQAGLTDGTTVPLAIAGQIVPVEATRLTDFIGGRNRQLREIDAVLGDSDGERLRFIVVRSPLAQGRGGDAGGSSVLGNRVLPEAAGFAAAIAREYGDRVDVFLANDLLLAAANIRRLPRITGGNRIGVLNADGVTTFDIVDNILPLIERMGVRLVGTTDVGIDAEKISAFVFPGHKDEAYREAVLAQAAKGSFKGSILALASCGERGEEVFNTELIRRAGARAVVYFNKEINPQAVEDVLAQFVRRLPRDGTSADFMQLWRSSVDAAAAANPQNRAIILELKAAIPQVSALDLVGRAADMVAPV